MSLSNHHIGNRVNLTSQASHSVLKKEGRAHLWDAQISARLSSASFIRSLCAQRPCFVWSPRLLLSWTAVSACVLSCACACMHVEVREWLMGALDFHHMSYRGQIQDSGLGASSFIPWATFLALLNCYEEEMGYLTAGISRHLLIEVEKGSGALNVTWEGLACFVYLPPFWSAQYLVPQPGSSGWSTWRVSACKQNSASSQHVPESGSSSKVVSPFQLGIWGCSSLWGAAPCAVECPAASY